MTTLQEEYDRVYKKPPMPLGEKIAGLGCLTVLGLKLLGTVALAVLFGAWLWRHL